MLDSAPGPALEALGMACCASGEEFAGAVPSDERVLSSLPETAREARDALARGFIPFKGKLDSGMERRRAAAADAE